MATSLNRNDWLEAGLRLISDGGPKRLSIDALCTAVGVTKGSFYHHFVHHADFVSAMLAHWQITHTQRLIDTVEGIKDPKQRGERLSQLVYAKNMKPEVALRAWGNSHPEVASAVAAVDAQRLAYLEELAQHMGADPQRALLMARIGYAHLIGIQHLPMLLTPDDAIEMDQLLNTLLFADVERKT